MISWYFWMHSCRSPMWTYDILKFSNRSLFFTAFFQCCCGVCLESHACLEPGHRVGSLPAGREWDQLRYRSNEYDRQGADRELRAHLSARQRASRVLSVATGVGYICIPHYPIHTHRTRLTLDNIYIYNIIPTEASHKLFVTKTSHRIASRGHCSIY